MLALLLSLASREAVAKPVILVFDVEAADAGLEPRAVEALTDFLTARLAETSFQCIPRAELRRRLQDEKAESYRSCVDEACQIELGRELAAEKTLSTKVLRLGAGCQLTAVLFDLRTAATERAATEEASCDEESLLAATRRAADRLAQGPAGSAAVHTATVPAAQVQASPAGPGPFVTCGADDSSPAILGWCRRGDFLGLVHLGILVYAGTAADVAGIGQVAIINRVGADFYGFVQGGLASFVGRDFAGFAEAGVVNVVGRDFTGLVQAGGYNQVGGALAGIQAGAINRADQVYGLQVGALNFARELHGVQLGVLNFAGNGLLGVLPILNVGF